MRGYRQRIIWVIMEDSMVQVVVIWDKCEAVGEVDQVFGAEVEEVEAGT